MLTCVKASEEMPLIQTTNGSEAWVWIEVLHALISQLAPSVMMNIPRLKAEDEDHMLRGRSDSSRHIVIGFLSLLLWKDASQRLLGAVLTWAPPMWESVVRTGIKRSAKNHGGGISGCIDRDVPNVLITAIREFADVSSKIIHRARTTLHQYKYRHSEKLWISGP